jgi:hypothetical protein
MDKDRLKAHQRYPAKTIDSQGLKKNAESYTIGFDFFKRWYVNILVQAPDTFIGSIKPAVRMS